ncbi:MAG: helix-turn-helix domain-containing protein [Myxacorys californica WJT36-NPBG1]|jgi:sugar-specific transcriptional regulator TrmB|nr:helix-turn-helix domain-containing protein [Myxacorys californica WJT36-NPBG1]
MTDTRIPWPFTAIPVDLDSYGLNPYAYRVLTHIIRRQRCFASLKNIAALCTMSVRQVQHALKILETNGMIEKRVRRGRTNVYTFISPDRWKQPDYSADTGNFNAQDFFNRALLRRERKDFQGALADLHESISLYEQELLEAQNQGRVASRKEQDIKDAKNEVLRLIKKRKEELVLNEEMSKWIKEIETEQSNNSEQDLDDLEDF